jgi:hypothetical protein
MMDPSIKPWDQIFMYDFTSDMYGPFEVDSVHHHIDTESGAWTSITPRAIVFQQDMTHIANSEWMNKVSKTFITSILASPVATGLVGTAVAGGPAGVVAAIGGLIGGTIVFGNLWTKAVGWLYGRQPINISGLWYKGAPYVAGLEGMRRDSVLVHLEDRLERATNFVGKIKGTVIGG